MFVLGCHRSGTSMLANLLHEALNSHGRSNRLANLEMLEGNSENPLGFFESKLLVATNEYLLQIVGADWDRPFLARPDWSAPQLLNKVAPLRERFLSYRQEPWVDKDPRLSLLWPVYRHLLLREPVAVAIIRDPRIVAGSLALRNGFSGEKSALIWWLYHYHLLSAAPINNLLCVDDSALLEQDSYTVNALLKFMQMHQSFEFSTKEFKSLARLYCHSDLRRAQPLIPVQDSLLDQMHHIWSQWKESGWNRKTLDSAFRRLPIGLLEGYHKEIGNSIDTESPLLSTSENKLAMEIHNLNLNINKTVQSISDLQCKLDDSMRSQRDKLNLLYQKVTAIENDNSCKKELVEIKRSTSWRVTHPLRELGKILHNVKARVWRHLRVK